VNAGMAKEEIDWLVMHQANMRIMSAAADRLGVPAGGWGCRQGGGSRCGGAVGGTLG